MGLSVYPGTAMRTRPLGNSDLHVTPIGFGAWAIGGGGWAFAWGPQDDADSVAAIREAIDLGVNWIDTAPVYGLGAWLQTLAAGTFQPLDTSLATVERFAAAYRDLR